MGSDPQGLNPRRRTTPNDHCDHRALHQGPRVGQLDGDVATVGITATRRSSSATSSSSRCRRLAARRRKGDAVAVVESVKAAADVSRRLPARWWR